MWRCVKTGLSGLAVIAAAVYGSIPSPAQNPIPQESRVAARASQQARESYRERLNENVLFLMGGQLGAAYIQIAQDIAVVVDDGPNLRVLPVVGGAGVQNVHDVIFLRGIDLALTNVQTLNLLRKSGELGPNLDRQISYITPLFPEEMQLLANGRFHSIEELQGKRVNFNSKGSATALLAPLIFASLGIDVKPFFMSQPDAIQKMRSDELDATVCICPKPIPALSAVRLEWGFKLLEVAFAPALQADYLPATISTEDYPNLLPKNEKLETIASSTVLITFNWPRGSTRYNRTAKFVDGLFSKFANLQIPPRHPLWQSVNYAANIPGWQRFPAAQEWLDRSRTVQSIAVETGFAEFVKQKKAQDSATGDISDPEEKERLFREYLEWSSKKRN